MPDLQVEGMSCQHCVKAVTGAVHSIDPAAQVDIDLSSGQVHIGGTSQPIDAFRSAIDEAGYTVLVDGSASK